MYDCKWNSVNINRNINVKVCMNLNHTKVNDNWFKFNFNYHLLFSSTSLIILDTTFSVIVVNKSATYLCKPSHDKLF